MKQTIVNKQLTCDDIIAELMILGFISLILTFSQSYIAKICIPVKVANTMLPCSLASTEKEEETTSRRRLLSTDRRFLAEATTTTCKSVSVPYSSPLNSTV